MRKMGHGSKSEKVQKIIEMATPSNPEVLALKKIISEIIIDRGEGVLRRLKQSQKVGDERQRQLKRQILQIMQEQLVEMEGRAEDVSESIQELEDARKQLLENTGGTDERSVSLAIRWQTRLKTLEEENLSLLEEAEKLRKKLSN